GDTKGDSLLEHSDRPFTLVGILAPTGTVLDKAIYVSLQSLEALHIDWEQGGPPAPGKVTPLDQINVDSIEVSSITSSFLRARSRIDSLRLQREINDW
ncbi:MAG: ABC transporter permease, partial [Bdellovibrionaceae bacterium]|nr:ABC transporter permease [Pseudobdellovibrionaceae bacterium]